MYAVRDVDLHWSPMSSFHTPAVNADNVTIAAFGDMGVDGAQILPLLHKAVLKKEIQAVFHVGDMAYNLRDKGGRVGDAFMRKIQPIASRIPYQVLPGNHERHDNFSHYDGIFSMRDHALQSTGEDRGISNFFYSVNLGPLHVVCVTNDFYFYHEKYGTAQLVNQFAWLSRDLETANLPANRAKRPWILLLSHRPMYASGKRSEEEERVITRKGLRGSRYGMEALMRKHRVDLFLSGHLHNYERSFPVFEGRISRQRGNEYRDPKYRIHVISGAAGSGETLRKPKPKHRLQPFSAKRLQVFSYTRISATRRRLQLKQVAVPDERIVDHLTITKSAFA